MGDKRWTLARVTALEKQNAKLNEKLRNLEERLTHLECNKMLVKTNILQCDYDVLNEVDSKIARTLWALKQLGGTGCADDVAKLMGNQRANASQYLCTLRGLGVVRSEYDKARKRKIFYLEAAQKNLGVSKKGMDTRLKPEQQELSKKNLVVVNYGQK